MRTHKHNQPVTQAGSQALWTGKDQKEMKSQESLIEWVLKHLAKTKH